jgi:hypothetical protein
VDPTWPAFATVQEAFLEKQRELYGNWTSHYYSLDLFNELAPSSLNEAYLTNNTRSVVSSLRAVDEDAVWVMQGWCVVAPLPLSSFIRSTQAVRFGVLLEHEYHLGAACRRVI